VSAVREGLVSFDVEEWFHVLDSEVVPPRDRWDQLASRTPEQIGRVLDLLEESRARVTFFVLGWFAGRHPEVVRRIHGAGHEIASHSDGHPLLYQLSRPAVLEELRKGRDVLEQVIGERVYGFRAPGFSIRAENAWALDCVVEAGFRYDSSLFPARRAHGGILGVRPEPHVLRTPGGSALAEVPISTVRILGLSIPFGGGGYLRLAPIRVTLALASLASRDGRPLVSYVHPRDLDPETPRLPLGPWRTFKCYVGLRGTAGKVRRLLCRYPAARYIDFLRSHGLVADA
jgi:polysaccharide deacetylase family protein (PEP-CTERM system associated)